MKQVININFHGQVVPIEVSAFDLLKNYTGSLSKFFENEEGKEEIINDIENRIAELFQERLKKGATCITDEDVNAIIKSMGRPEDFETEDESSYAGKKEESTKGNQQSFTNTGFSTANRRLYRDENDKVIGGVCSGLANYFNIDPVIMRIIFVVVALAFGTGVLAYIIMWIAVPSSASTVIGSTRKKFFRDPDDKIVAGVCSGIGNYFGFNPWIPRLLFLLPFLSFVFHWGRWGFMDFPNFINFTFSPGSLIIYIILWLVFPEASSTAEKLEMKGEKVDMNSIKNSVMEEMKGVQQRAGKFAKEATAVAGEKGKVMGSEIKNVAARSGRSLGDVIIFIVKAIAYFIIGCVSFALVIALFALAIVSIGLFPLKDFILTDGWQNALAWGTLLFFIAVPVIGVITFIIRRLAKMRSNRTAFRTIFISLWVIGWICFFGLISFIGRDFTSSSNIVEQEIVLTNPTLDKLEITNNAPEKKLYRYNSFRLEPFESIEDDTAFVKNIEIKFVKSLNDSFKVVMVKMANGRNRRAADTLSNKIEFNAMQKDSLLILDRGIAINKTDKFRNQRIIITVFVPVGKRIKVDRNIGWGHNVYFSGPWNDRDFNLDLDDEEKGWDENVEYIMKADGLYTLDGKPADEWKHKKDNKINIDADGIEINSDGKKIKIDDKGIKIQDAEKNNYRYNSTPAINNIDSLKKQSKLQQQQTKDSLKKLIEDTKKQLDKVAVVNMEPISISSFESPLFIPFLKIN